MKIYIRENAWDWSAIDWQCDTTDEDREAYEAEYMDTLRATLESDYPGADIDLDWSGNDSSRVYVEPSDDAAAYHAAGSIQYLRETVWDNLW